MTDWGNLDLKCPPSSNELEGLRVLKTESVNGVLLDLEMPIMEGLTMLNQLRQKIFYRSGDRDVYQSHSIDDD